MNKYLLALVLVLGISANAQETIIRTGGGGGTSGSITGAYSFSAGFTTVNATNVSLLPAISNLAINLPATQASGGLTLSGGLISLNPAISNLVLNPAITNIGSALLEASNYYARVVLLTTNDNLSLTLSNAQNNTAYILSPGSYAVTPSVLISNVANGTQYRGISFLNKTNIGIFGTPGFTIVDGSSDYGELMAVSNCLNIRIEYAKWIGKTNHNWWEVDLNGYLWSGISIANSADIYFENNEVERHLDHGISDLAAFPAMPTVLAPSTNNINVRFNTFSDIGSWRTNLAVAYDGTSVVPTGWRVSNNRFKNVLRGVEPFLTGNGTIVNNCIITDNDMEGVFDLGIGPAGSTNFNNVVVKKNRIYTPFGFSFHGSNSLYSAGSAIAWNGGNYWDISDNNIGGNFAQGITTGNGVFGGTISKNTLSSITNFYSSGFHLYFSTSYRLAISDNVMTGAKLASIYVFGLRDSEVSRNVLFDPSYLQRTGIRIATFGAGVSSNVTFKANRITDSVNSRLTYGIEDQLGGTFKMKFIGNEIQNAGTDIYNQSGAEWDIYTTTVANTNKIVRQFELNTVSNVLAAASGGGSGGTNFPAVLLQAGNTNYTLQAGKRTSHYMITNASHGLDADLAAPASGHSFLSRITNSASTDITVTFFTNGAVATYYESVDQTNSGTSFIVPAGSLVASEFTWLGNYWVREQRAGPELRPKAGTGIAFSTNGLDWTITSTASGVSIGGSGAIQAAQESSFTGTNDPATQQFNYNITNGVMTILKVGQGALMLNGNALIQQSSTFLYLGTAGVSNWAINNLGNLQPIGSNTADIGTIALPVRTNYANQFDAKVGFSVYGVPIGNSWGVNGPLAGVGGANTNYTLQAIGSGSRPVSWIDAGTTNVNIVAIMQGSATIANRGTLLLTNRTATARIFSLGTATNNWVSLQQYDGVSAPFTITNSQAARFEWEIIGTNVFYALKPMALPTN